MDLTHPLFWNQFTGLAAFFALVVQILWLLLLVRAIRNPNFSEIERFMWVFIVVMLNIVGALLYVLMAPGYSSARGSQRGSFLNGDRGMSPAEYERRQRQPPP